MNQVIKSGYYRVSLKALILDETRTKFLLVQEHDGLWELPGGGWDWGETHDECMKRELREEMGLIATSVSKTPAYLVPGHMNLKREIWITNVLFEVVVQNLNFTPSDECIAVQFVTPEEALELNAYENVKLFAAQFDSKNHA